LKNSNGSDIFGRGVPGAIWQRFMDSYLKGAPMEVFAPYHLIGPAAPPPPVEQQPTKQPTRTREPRSSTPSATPEPNFGDLVPVPIEPSTKPARPQHDGCFPFCDAQPPSDGGPNSQGG
jgi:hypothetical protein